MVENRINVPCGSCAIVADPFTGFVLGGGNTDYSGNATATLPIPLSTGLVGRRFFMQWWTGGGSSCLGFDLSDALEVEIQQ